MEDVGIVVEMNTMRLLEHKKVYLTLTRKSDGKELMKVDLIPYLLLTKWKGTIFRHRNISTGRASMR